MSELPRQLENSIADMPPRLAAWLAWRATMRALPSAIGGLPPFMVDALLRELLVCDLFLRGRLDRRSVGEARDAARLVRKDEDALSNGGQLRLTAAADALWIAASAVADAVVEDGNNTGYAVDALRRACEIPMPGQVRSIESDLLAIAKDEGDPLRLSLMLWPNELGTFEDLVSDERGKWLPRPLPAEFWDAWFLSVVRGGASDSNLALEVARIPDQTWRQGGSVLKDAIDSLYDRNRAAGLMDGRARPATGGVQIIRDAIDRNRVALPATFDALEGLLLLELERLKRKNFFDEEVRRQTSIYLALYETATALRATVPLTEPATTQQAQEVEKLSDLYIRKFSELPRKKADDVVESVCALGIVGVSGALLTALGAPALAAFAISAAVAVPKKAADLIKAVKEGLKGP